MVKSHTKAEDKYKNLKVIKVGQNAMQGGSSDKIINESADPHFDGEDRSSNTYLITYPVIPAGMPPGPGFGGRRRVRRQTKTFPRGILRKTAKIRPSRTPSKAPHTRRSVKLLTEGGVEKARKTAKAKAAHMDIGTIRKRLVEKKVISAEKKNIPPTILRTLYADSVSAGLLS